MGGLSISKALSRCYKAACGLLRRLCHGGRRDFCSGGQKFSTTSAPPIGLWLLEGESGGVKVEPGDGRQGDGRQGIREPTIMRFTKQQGLRRRHLYWRRRKMTLVRLSLARQRATISRPRAQEPLEPSLYTLYASSRVSRYTKPPANIHHTTFGI